MATNTLREGRLGGVGRAAVALGLLAALVAPWVMEPYSLDQLAMVFYFTVAVVSMNLLVGLNGQISIGHSAFIAVGAYVVVLSMNDLGLPFLLALALAIVASMAIGALAALPSLRLSPLFVALASLGLALATPALIQAMSKVTGGTVGMPLDDRLGQPAGLDLNPEQWVYLISLVACGLALVLVRNLKLSRMGRAMQATRDQPLVAATFGIATRLVRIAVFAISAGMAGLAGGMFAIQREYVSPADFTLTLSISLLIGMVLGGSTSVLGALAGGLFLQYVPVWSGRVGLPPEFAPLVYGALLIVLVLAFRRGLAGAMTDLAGRRNRDSGDSRGEPVVRQEQSRASVA